MDKTRLVCLVAGLYILSFLFFPGAAQANVSFSPASLKFGSVIVGATSNPQTLVFANNGSEALTLDKISCNSSDFLITGPVLPVSLAAQKSVSFQVEFRPSSVSAYTGNITAVADGTAGTVSSTIQVSGTGIALTHLLTADVSNLAFGNLLVGSAVSHGFSLTNRGTGDVTISQIMITGAGFSISEFPAGGVTLASGKSFSLDVKFAPQVTGSVSGTFHVVSTATNSPIQIPVSGTGVQPALSVVPSSVKFGNVAVGVTNSQTMTIQNPGTANLTLPQSTLSGAGYSMSGLVLPLSIAPGGSAAFNIAFAPASAGNFPGSLNLVSNAPSSPTSITLSGTGIAPALKLSASPTTLNFGNLTTGASASQSVTVTNTGNSSVTISQISASGTGFSTTGVALPVSLAVGQSTSFNVAFTPAVAESLTGSVTVTSNATNSPLVLSLSGTATAPAAYSANLAWSPSSSRYAGFHIYRGTVSGGPYSKIDSSLIPAPAYTDSGVTSGKMYYYVATEVDSSGDESAYSSEVSAVIP